MIDAKPMVDGHTVRGWVLQYGGIDRERMENIATTLVALESRVAELEKATIHLPPEMAEGYAAQIEEYRINRGQRALKAHALRDYAAALRSADKGQDGMLAK